MLAIYSYTFYSNLFKRMHYNRMQTDIDIKIPSSFHILLTREGGKQVDLLL